MTASTTSARPTFWRRSTLFWRSAALGALAVTAVFSAGCGANPSVARLVDGKPTTARYIEPQAYDAYLRGALAESSGRDAEALAAFDAAASDDGDDPDIWTRIGALRCRSGGDEASAKDAFRHALAADSAFGPAYRALGDCAALRGHGEESRAAYARASAVDPGAASAVVFAEQASAADGLLAVTALTEHRPEDPASWKALAGWARAHRDHALFARSMVRALELDTTLRLEVGRGAEWLAHSGRRHEALILAGLAADHVDDPLTGRRAPLSPLASLLAIDDALERGDEARVLRRSVEVALPIETAALRAHFLGKVMMVEPALRQRALAGTDAAKLLATVASPMVGTSPALAALLERAFPSAAVPGDDLLDAVFADAAARGFLPEKDLSAESAIELAARKGLDPDPLFSRAPRPSSAANVDVDPRYRLLALSLAHPTSPETALALAELGGIPREDRVVAVARARIALALPSMPDADIARALEASVQAGDPLATAAALDLASRRHDAAAMAKLGTQLARLAATDAERRRSISDAPSTKSSS